MNCDLVLVLVAGGIRRRGFLILDSIWLVKIWRACECNKPFFFSERNLKSVYMHISLFSQLLELKSILISFVVFEHASLYFQKWDGSKWSQHIHVYFKSFMLDAYLPTLWQTLRVLLLDKVPLEHKQKNCSTQAHPRRTGDRISFLSVPASARYGRTWQGWSNVYSRSIHISETNGFFMRRVESFTKRPSSHGSECINRLYAFLSVHPKMTAWHH